MNNCECGTDLTPLLHAIRDAVTEIMELNVRIHALEDKLRTRNDSVDTCTYNECCCREEKGILN